MIDENVEQQNIKEMPESVEKKEEKQYKTSWSVIIFLLILSLLIIAGIWRYLQMTAISLQVPPFPITENKYPLKEDSTQMINQELENIETADLEEEFKIIDQDLNSL